MTTESMLWQPSAERIARANITEFARRAAGIAGRPFPDYAALWRWSTEEREAFWRALWDFAGVIGERGARTLVDPTKMPGRPLVPRRAAQLRREPDRPARRRRRWRCARVPGREQVCPPRLACGARRDGLARRDRVEGARDCVG
jgi:hypothetical protein